MIKEFSGGRIQDTGYRYQDSGATIQDTGSWIKQTRYKRQDTRYRMQGARCKIHMLILEEPFTRGTDIVEKGFPYLNINAHRPNPEGVRYFQPWATPTINGTSTSHNPEGVEYVYAGERDGMTMAGLRCLGTLKVKILNIEFSSKKFSVPFCLQIKGLYPWIPFRAE